MVAEHGDRIAALCEWIANQREAFLSGHPVLHVLARLASPLVSTAFRCFGAAYTAEITGMAKACGVRVHDLLLGNLAYDLSLFQIGGVASACSSGSVDGRNGPVLVRTMDWTLPPVGPDTVLIRFHRSKQSYLSVGVSGFVGVLSAVRPGAWGVTLNQAPIAQARTRITQMPACMLLRDSCDAANSWTALIRGLTAYQAMSPFFAHTIGARKGQQRVIEHFGDHARIRRPRPKTPLVQTNHYTDPQFASFNGPESWTDDAGDTWYDTSWERYTGMEYWLKTRPWRSGRGAALEVSICPGIVDDTQQLMIIEPGSQRPLTAWWRDGERA